MTYYLDNEDGLINLYRYDRTNKNHLAYSKGDSVGKIMAIIVNELDLLPKYESISVTIEKPLSDIRDIDEAKSQRSEEDREMVAWLIRCCEEENKELCNDRYGHQEIVSDLKRDCRNKWDWLEKLQKIMED